MILFAILWQAQIWLTDTAELRGSKFITVPCGLLSTVPFLWRRRAPRAVAACVYVAAALEVAVLRASLPIGFLISTVVAASALGAYLEQRPSLWALALALVSVWITAVMDPNKEGPVSVILIGPIFVGIPWMAGRQLQRMRAQHSSLESLTVRLEHEREENARNSILEERSRIARELHDIVAHSLSVMVVQAGAAEQVLESAPERAREPLEAIRTTGQQALIEMRRLLGILRTDNAATPLAPQPGLDSLDALAEQARAAGLRVDVLVDGDRPALSPGLDVAVYRLIQESLTNTRKHARASCVQVLVRFDVDSLDVEVTDDGRPAAPVDVGSGHGLIGIQERVALYGGRVQTGPRPDGGWSVKARLPLSG